MKYIRFLSLTILLLSSVCSAEIFNINAMPHTLLLTDQPVVTVSESGEVTIEYETYHLTPPCKVYYGAVMPDMILDYPRYRSSASEVSEGESLKHSIKFKIKSIEKYIPKRAEHWESGQGDIYYRLEIFDPKDQMAKLFDRKFRYSRTGDKVYKKIPCIIEGPFVDLVQEDGATLSWRTDVSTFGSVSIGEVTYPSVNAKGKFVSRKKHIVQIKGLESSEVFKYNVNFYKEENDIGSWSGTFAFKTAPSGRKGNEVIFAVMTDSRVGVGGGERAVEGVNAKTIRSFFTAAFNRGVELVCFPGDLINGYVASTRDYREQLQAWKRAIQPVGHYIPIYEGMGNHELVGNYMNPENRWDGNFYGYSGKNSGEHIFSQEFVNPRNGPPRENKNAPTYQENVYSFDYGKCHFVMVNSNYWMHGWGDDVQDKGNLEGFIMKKQMNWLAQDLEAAREKGQKHLFVFTHEPAFPNGGHTRDAMWYDGKRPEVLEMRDEFWGICSKNKVVAVFFGDEHNYSRTIIGPEFDPKFPNPVTQIITGGCGAPFYPQSETPWTQFVEKFDEQQHWCLVRVKGKRVMLDVYGENHRLIESVRLK